MPAKKMFTIRRELIKYVTKAPHAKSPILLFTLIGMRLRNSKMTTVKMRKLSMPAQGHAMEKLAEARLFGSAAVKVGVFSKYVMLVV